MEFVAAAIFFGLGFGLALLARNALKPTQRAARRGDVLLKDGAVRLDLMGKTGVTSGEPATDAVRTPNASGAGVAEEASSKGSSAPRANRHREATRRRQG